MPRLSASARLASSFSGKAWSFSSDHGWPCIVLPRVYLFGRIFRAVQKIRIMTQLKDKIQNVMDESRMLVLGAEILIGFEFTATFQEGFRKLSSRSQDLNVIALTLMLFTLVLLISPSSFHQLAERGEDSVRVHCVATGMTELALLPFALGLGANMYIRAEEINGSATGLAFGFATASLAFFFWYGPMLLRDARAGKMHRQENPSQTTGQTPVHDKIRQVLTEARVIIPGNQALLGFQFAVILQRGFSELPRRVQWVHLASLSLIAVSTILLLTPAAYHPIVEQGEETEGFYFLAHAMVLSSLPLLATGVSGDFFVVLYKMTERLGFSVAGGIVMLFVFVGVWFGYPWFRRNHSTPVSRPAMLEAAEK